jgi:hypothetical protein
MRIVGEGQSRKASKAALYIRGSLKFSNSGRDAVSLLGDPRKAANQITREQSYVAGGKVDGEKKAQLRLMTSLRMAHHTKREPKERIKKKQRKMNEQIGADKTRFLHKLAWPRLGLSEERLLSFASFAGSSHFQVPTMCRRVLLILEPSSFSSIGDFFFQGRRLGGAWLGGIDQLRLRSPGLIVL